MKLTFGRVVNPAELNLEPIEVTLVGYTADHVEVPETIRFRPVSPTWDNLELSRQTRPDGTVPVAAITRFLDNCIMVEDRERWQVFLQRPDVFIQEQTLVDLYQGVMEAYNARPTVSVSTSSGGPTSTGQTSTVGANGSGSTLPPSPPSADST